MQKREVYLLLGSNLDDRRNQLARALKGLAEFGKVTAVSSLYETEAWGNEDQPMFLNQAVALETDLDPQTLLARVKKLETALGRTKDAKWQPRIIDIDLLGIGDLVCKSDLLTLPHPQMHLRNFALIPMLDIAPLWVHPVLKQTIEELYLHSPDQREVFIFSEE